MAGFRFNANDLQRLNRLAFLPRAASADEQEGTRRSRRGGAGTEFLDFRSYTSGDDVRKVDWNVYSRTRQLFVRITESPRQLAVTLLIDASRSMGFGAHVSKLEHAQRIACALGFIAMRSGDRVFATAYAQSVIPGVGPLRGAGGLASLVKFLQTLEPGGSSNLTEAVRQVQLARRDRGLIVIVSDFLNVPSREQAIAACGAAGGNVLALQILDPIDRGEGLSGKVRLRDSESGRMVDVDLDRAGLDDYQTVFESERARFERFCTARKRWYVLTDTRENYLDVVCQAMRAKGVLQ